jgi:mannose/fructose/N-acetylgalactosamine-specific phosphotransferase system component IID
MLSFPPALRLQYSTDKYNRKEILMRDCRFFWAQNRDVPITMTTMLGCMIGLLMSVNSSQPEMQCNVLCGAAYGAFTGIGLSLVERLYGRYVNGADYTELSDEKNLSL